MTPLEVREQRLVELRARKDYWQRKRAGTAEEAASAERMVELADTLLGQAERALEEEHERESKKSARELVPEPPKELHSISAFVLLFQSLQEIRDDKRSPEWAVSLAGNAMDLAQARDSMSCTNGTARETPPRDREDMIAYLLDELRMIRDERDHIAEHGTPELSRTSECFDDWAADVADGAIRTATGSSGRQYRDRKRPVDQGANLRLDILDGQQLLHHLGMMVRWAAIARQRGIYGADAAVGTEAGGWSTELAADIYKQQRMVNPGESDQRENLLLVQLNHMVTWSDLVRRRGVASADMRMAESYAAWSTAVARETLGQYGGAL